MLTSSDPYKSGDMTLSVSYDGNTDTFSTGSFDQAMLKEQSITIQASTSNNYTFDNFRARQVGGYGYNPSGFSGFFSGILEFDVSGTGNSNWLRCVRALPWQLSLLIRVPRCASCGAGHG